MRTFKKFLVALMILSMVFSVVGCGGDADEPESGDGEAPESGPIEDEEISVGMIYIGPPGDAGWTYAHDEGRKYLEEKMPNVKVKYVESVPESSDSERIMTQMVEEGAQIVFATSFGYMDFMMNVAEKYPEVTFFHCSGYKTRENMSAYFGRMYQARYLTGMVAGKMTKNNEIGYVAAHPIPEVIRGINGFTLGVRATNPDANVNVIWTNTWYDAAKEKDAAQGLLDSGVDIIAQHQDTPGPQQAAEEAGVYSVGYNTDMSGFAPKAHLTSAVWDWGPYYVSAVQSVVDGSYESSNYWGGLESKMIDIAPFHADVPKDVVDAVEKAKQELINGDWDVFDGPIKDQDGEVRVAEGESLTDGEKIELSWFVEGVKGTIPE